MPQFTRMQARMYSKLGMRGSFSLAVEELAKTDSNLLVLTADLASLTGLSRFKEKFPSQFLNIGIAEQNMVGIGAGLAKEGMKVFLTTYSNFLSMRAYEQIRILLGYMGFNVKVVGTGSGLSMGMSGNTHYGIEDISLMRALPGMTVISPADGFETVKSVHEVMGYEKPVYIRLTGVMNTPIVYNEDYDFTIGRGVILRKGDDISIITTGTMVHESLMAAEQLAEQGTSASVINMHTIKPLDTSLIHDAVLHSKLIVTIEEHSVIGGLGGAVAEYVSGLIHHPPLIRIGLPDSFQKVGDYSYLLKQNGLTGLEIADRLSDEMKRID